MPFLPMKYPEYRISMEATLPSSVQCWLRHELEQRGIDSIVYTRYIISLLLQDGEDFEGSDPDFESFPRSKRKGRKSERQGHLSTNEEERKKFAVVKCLSAISDEKSGLENLVEELCSRLKDKDSQASDKTEVKSRSCSSDCSEESGSDTKDKAQKYYAAFPALHGQSASTNKSPSESVWRNNPFVKSVLTSEEESSSANEDAEIRKINVPLQEAVPKHRKPRKNNSRNKKDFHDNRKRDSRNNNDNGKGKRYKKNNNSSTDIPKWPPGFAKLDPIILQSLNLVNEDAFIQTQIESPKRPHNELCTKVESLLKGMLLPAPEKYYKELQDVDDIEPDNMKQKVDKKREIITVEAKLQSELEEFVKSDVEIKDEMDTKRPDDSVHPPREDSVSPELQEQEIWYTQPIDVIFQSQEDEVTTNNSKLRLYKRNSNPVFSPDTDSASESATEYHHCVTSSPVSCERKRNQSFTSDDDNVDIWEGSVLIPAWLTEVISNDEHSDENIEDIDLTHSLRSSSPVPNSDSGCVLSKLADLSMSDDGFSFAFEDSWKPASFSSELSREPHQPDDNCTPTPDDVFKPEDDSTIPADRPLSVSLVDLNYLSKFLSINTEWQAFSPEELIGQGRTCFSTLWQSQVLFDVTLNVADNLSDMNDFSCWHPLGTSPYSQLWDVNMQKRSKVSSWCTQIPHTDDQVWLAENNFVFMHDVPVLEFNNLEHKANTLIPRISIDIVSEISNEGSSFLVDEDNGCDDVPYDDQNISIGVVSSMWSSDKTKKVDPKLSKSFELVPSEHSAFNDVPRKLIHTHSEPNLVQFRKEFGDGHDNGQPSPQEHLYFSPKTHFRPITPAYLPELFSAKAKQQVCQDLFGGLPTTKTPYQQYQILDKESDEESFIPSFKVKNASKSIQTGESFDKADSSEESSESVGRDTPETLTLSIIEDVMEEKIETLLSVVDEQDTANTDSAYETDYGGYQGTDFENDLKNGSCCYQQNKLLENPGLFPSVNIDSGYIGDLASYKVESFEATFPHTSDWPDVVTGVTQSETCWKETDLDHTAEPWPPVECPSLLHDEEYVDSGYQNMGHGTWGEDFCLDHLYRESEMEKYKNIWSSAGQEYYSVEVGVPASTGTGESFHGSGEEEYDNIPAVDYYKNLLAESYSDVDNCYQYCPIVDGCEQPIEDNVGDVDHDPDNVFPFYAGFPEQDCVDLLENGGPSAETDSGDYLCVKLVYKDKKDDSNTQQSYGKYDLMPMPDEAVTLTELEKEWLDTSVQSMWTTHKPSSAQRKPCSFYLEGNCRRSDCKFAHDISNITCRFWEEGGCFKGPLCPFLHGYPRVLSPREVTESPEELDKEKFDINNEEFPELSLSVKNGNTVNVNPKKNKVKSTATGRKEKGKKGSGRRHSNKENRCEVKIINKCSSSV